MDPASAALVSLIIILTVALCGSYGWYNYVGWTSFSFTGDPNNAALDAAAKLNGTTRPAGPYWTPQNDADISRLRFKDCVFTVKRSDAAVPAVKEVTANLNSMAVAYKDSPSKINTTTLKLTRYLNPFSFPIPGFNDKATAPNNKDPVWINATVTLTGKVRTI